MSRTTLGLLVAVFLSPVFSHLSAGDDAKEDAIRKDRQKVEGKWRATSLEVNGMKSSEEDARKIEVVNGVDGSWTLFTDGNEIGKGTSTIDPTKKPRQIDFTITEGNGAGNKYHGIYETGDKTRKLCFGPAEKERPAKFASAMGSEHIFVVFERESKK